MARRYPLQPWLRLVTNSYSRLLLTWAGHLRKRPKKRATTVLHKKHSKENKTQEVGLHCSIFTCGL